MNTIMLNTLSDGKVVIRKEGNGGGAPSGGGSKIEYLDVSQIEDTSIIPFLCMMGIAIDMDYPNGRLILPASLGGAMAGNFKVYKVAVCDDFNINFTIVGGQPSVTTLRPIKEFLFENGITQEQIDSIPRITEEEFYNLEA